MRFRLHLFNNNFVERIGVQTGPTKLVAKNDEFIVLKVDGHNAYIDRIHGQTYVPARYELHRYTKIREFMDCILVETPDLRGIMDWPVTTPKAEYPTR